MSFNLGGFLRRLFHRHCWFYRYVALKGAGQTGEIWGRTCKICGKHQYWDYDYQRYV